MASNEKPPEPGHRKDGQPYAPNNTRSDGSYIHGKGRPSEQHKFKEGDGRPRGRRARGTKNLATEWNEELNAKMVITEGGKKKKITKRRAVIKTQIDRAIKSSDRAAQTAFRYAELSERREPTMHADDFAIIDSFLAGHLRASDSFDDSSDQRAGQSPFGDDVGDGVTGDA